MTRIIAMAFAAITALTSTSHAANRIQEVTSPGGITAWLVEEHAIPIISIEISFKGGAMLDPAGKEGVANLLSGMFDEGAGDLDTVAFSEAADSIAARYSFGAERERFSVSATMLSENRDASIDLLKLALTQPRFDEEPLVRVKRQVISGIRSAETDPNSIAGKAFRAAAFPDDPYGRPTTGDVATVEALSADDLHAARERLLNINAAKIGVVGDITAAELGPLLDRLLGDLPRAAPPVQTAATYQGAPGIQVIDLDVPQSVAIFGHEGILRDDPDYIPAYVMNYVLGGGGFSSRLTEEVREKRGLSYSVYSYLLPADRAGLYLGGVATANPAMKTSLEVIAAEWRRMAEDGISAEELDKAKQYLTGAYALRFDSNGKIANILVGVQNAGLGIDYIDRRNDLVRAVTVEDIKRVAARILRPDNLMTIVVGRPEGLE
ncbi:MAG: M16 family metallopeptidase [Pikeienuella sp.]